MSKYVIIDAEAIQKRIDELEKKKKKLNRFIDTTEYTILNNLIKQLQNILSQSTPLVPEIEKAIDYGIRKSFGSKKHSEVRQDYIKNLMKQ